MQARTTSLLCLLGDGSLAQFEHPSATYLSGELVLQNSPLAQVATALTALDKGVLSGSLRNIHQDFTAGLAFKLAIKTHFGHSTIVLLISEKASPPS